MVLCLLRTCGETAAVGSHHIYVLHRCDAGLECNELNTHLTNQSPRNCFFVRILRVALPERQSDVLARQVQRCLTCIACLSHLIASLGKLESGNTRTAVCVCWLVLAMPASFITTLETLSKTKLKHLCTYMRSYLTVTDPTCPALRPWGTSHSLNHFSSTSTALCSQLNSLNAVPRVLDSRRLYK